MRVLLTGTIHIPLDEQCTVLPELDRHIELTLAEPGCLWFRVEADPNNPEIYIVDEGFINEVAFAYHQTRGAASR